MQHDQIKTFLSQGEFCKKHLFHRFVSQKHICSKVYAIFDEYLSCTTTYNKAVFLQSASADCSINNLLFSKVNPKLDRANQWRVNYSQRLELSQMTWLPKVQLPTKLPMKLHRYGSFYRREIEPFFYLSQDCFANDANHWGELSS